MDLRTMQLMPAIRHDLDLVNLDLPVFEAMVKSLSCAKPDEVTLRQLDETADRLEGRQRRLGAYIGIISNRMESKLGDVDENEKALTELMEVNDKIQDNVQLLRSYKKMLHCEQEKMVERSLEESRSEAAGTTVTTVENQPETLSAAFSVAATAPAEASIAAKTNAAVTESTEKNDILQTLSDVREAIELFQILQQQINMSQAVDATQRRDLEVVVERLEALEKKVHALITASRSESSTDITAEADMNLSYMTSLNDELLRCIEDYQQIVRRKESAKQPGPERETEYNSDLDPDKHKSAIEIGSSALYDRGSTVPPDFTDNQASNWK